MHGAGKKPWRMLSIPDMAILGAAALLLFGPDQLPGVMRRAGAAMREVQNASLAFIREMERAAETSAEDVTGPAPSGPTAEPAPQSDHPTHV